MDDTMLLHDETVEIDPSLYPGLGRRSLDYGVLDDLMGSKSSRRLRKFVEKWQPLLPSTLYDVDEQENLRAARDMRRIIQALIRATYSYADRLTRAWLEAKGVHFGLDAPYGDSAIVRIAFESRELARYIEDLYRVSADGLLGLSGSRGPADRVDAVSLGRLLSTLGPAFASFGEVEAWELNEEPDRFLAVPDMPRDRDAWQDTYRTLDIRIRLTEAYDSDSPEVLHAVLEELFNSLLLGVGVRYRVGGAFPLVPDVFTGLVLLLSTVLDGSSANYCKMCGDPMLAPRKGGKKKLFCSESCRQRFLKVKTYYELMQLEGLSPDAAARAARINRKSADETVWWNRGELDRHVERVRAEREAEAGSDEGPNGH